MCLINDVLKDHNHIYDYLMLTKCLYLEMGSWGQQSITLMIYKSNYSSVGSLAYRDTTSECYYHISTLL